MRVAINLFIACYLAIAVFWHFPTWTFWRRLIAPISPLVERFGFSQAWAMFAPDPNVAERSMHVLLPRPGRDAVRWDPPRATPGSHVSAFFGFRRRLLELMAVSAQGAPVRRALAAYLLRKYDFQGAPPAEVLFVCCERVVAPPWMPEPPVPATFVFDTITPEQLNGLAERGS
jgi:hypothetical protein